MQNIQDKEETVAFSSKAQVTFAYTLTTFTFGVVMYGALGSHKYTGEFSIDNASFVMIALQFGQIATIKGKPKTVLIYLCSVMWLVISFISLQLNT